MRRNHKTVYPATWRNTPVFNLGVKGWTWGMETNNMCHEFVQKSPPRYSCLLLMSPQILLTHVPSEHTTAKIPSSVHSTRVEAGCSVFSCYKEGRLRKKKGTNAYIYLSMIPKGNLCWWTKERGRNGCRTRKLKGTGWACSAQASITPTNLYVTTLAEMPLNLKHAGNKIMSSRSGETSLLRAKEFYFLLTCHPY